MVNKRVIKTPVKMVKTQKKGEEVEQQSKPDFHNYLNQYEFDYTIPGMKEKVKIQPLTTGQIKKLLMYEGQEEDISLMTIIFDNIINESIISPNFNLGELYLQSRFSLLLEIRKITKGAIHEFEYTCEECGSQSINKLDLNDLDETPFPETIDHIVKINDDISLEMDLLKREDEYEVLETIKLLKKDLQLGELQEQAEFALMLEAAGIKRIILPEGEQQNLTLMDKKYFVENIPKFLHDKIKNWYTKYDFGIDFKMAIKCHHCDFKKEIDIPYDNFFF